MKVLWGWLKFAKFGWQRPCGSIKKKMENSLQTSKLTDKQTDDRRQVIRKAQVNYTELNEYEIIISVDHNRCSDLTKKRDNYVERLHKKWQWSYQIIFQCFRTNGGSRIRFYGVANLNLHKKEQTCVLVYTFTKLCVWLIYSLHITTYDTPLIPFSKPRYCCPLLNHKKKKKKKNICDLTIWRLCVHIKLFGLGLSHYVAPPPSFILVHVYINSNDMMNLKIFMCSVFNTTFPEWIVRTCLCIGH